ncbi:GNAT family N-acetyltransferase [Mucilaginibacter polytrichastri]|uniref:N-acetyltransferase domain-containing protein n=1 Tax=Mucilaginibacter polytrichastri TaxID=1302689 RepID=A0A1Q5ZY70_9SPHI|nr:GNAT family N-acetyltransferase [Mucilaginibacter polytrichastri]OKS86710.1 hypothetical protein RG47T_2167 [Mucilaginibacter polytrichastri]SFS82519.1 Acetyltransferase (GNAT) family protein [Mucilaginibacter polytrichastri]
MHNIIKGIPSDAERISELIIKIWSDCNISSIDKQKIFYLINQYQTPAIIRDQISNSTQSYLLLTWYGRLASFLSYSFLDDEPGIYIHQVYSLREMQGKGLLKALFNQIELIATNAGRQDIYICLDTQNLSLEYYSGLGFYVHPEKNLEIAKISDHKMIMHKKLRQY